MNGKGLKLYRMKNYLQEHIMKKRKIFLFLIAAVFGLLIFSGSLLANARHFTYTYESAVLPADEKEIEAWHTEKAGKDRYYHAIDQRLEIEWGITGRLQGAFYLNFSSEQTEDIYGTYSKSNKLFGSSLELKYRILDQSQSPIGIALYGEVLSKAHETEAEFKLIMDKRVGPILLAANLIGEREWVYQAGKNEVEDMFGASVGISFLPGAGLSLGAELYMANEYKKGEGIGKKSFYGGPNLSYDAGSWWFSLSLMPRLKVIQKEDEEGPNDKINARFLLGLHI